MGLKICGKKEQKTKDMEWCDQEEEKVKGSREHNGNQKNNWEVKSVVLVCPKVQKSQKYHYSQLPIAQKMMKMTHE